MPQFQVDDDLAALVWQLANPKPFENLTFSAALRRLLQGRAGSAAIQQRTAPSDSPLGSASTFVGFEPKKAPTPSPTDWVLAVPELKSKKGLHTWKAICVLLKINTAGDSARRKLKNWVRLNRPEWPAVPDID